MRLGHGGGVSNVVEQALRVAPQVQRDLHQFNDKGITDGIAMMQKAIAYGQQRHNAAKFLDSQGDDRPKGPGVADMIDAAAGFLPVRNYQQIKLLCVNILSNMRDRKTNLSHSTNAAMVREVEAGALMALDGLGVVSRFERITIRVKAAQHQHHHGKALPASGRFPDAGAAPEPMGPFKAAVVDAWEALGKATADLGIHDSQQWKTLCDAVKNCHPNGVPEDKDAVAIRAACDALNEWLGDAAALARLNALRAATGSPVPQVAAAEKPVPAGGGHMPRPAKPADPAPAGAQSARAREIQNHWTGFLIGCADIPELHDELAALNTQVMGNADENTILTRCRGLIDKLKGRNDYAARDVTQGLTEFGTMIDPHFQVAGKGQAQGAQPAHVAGAHPQEPAQSACMKDIRKAAQHLEEQLKRPGAGRFRTSGMSDALRAIDQCPASMEKHSVGSGMLSARFAVVYADIDKNLANRTYSAAEAPLARAVLESVGKVIDATGQSRPTPFVMSSAQGAADDPPPEYDEPPEYGEVPAGAMEHHPEVPPGGHQNAAAALAQPAVRGAAAPEKTSTAQVRQLVEILMERTRDLPDSDLNRQAIVRLSRQIDAPGANRLSVSSGATILASMLRNEFGEGTSVDRVAQAVAKAAKDWAAQ